MSHFIDKQAGYNIGAWGSVLDQHGNTVTSYPLFTDLIPPHGNMPRKPETHALWYFFVIAHRRLRDIEKDVNYEVDGYTEQSEIAKAGIAREFMRIANMTASLYNVNLDDVFATELVKGLREHCVKQSRAIDKKVLNWILSGGNPYWQPEQGDYWFSSDDEVEGESE